MSDVIQKLFNSFDELERSITTARKSLIRRDPIPLMLLKRVSQYEEMLTKQRKLAQELCRHIHSENWDEVARHTKLINAFSSMIYNDAIALTAGIISGNDSIPEDATIS